MIAVAAYVALATPLGTAHAPPGFSIAAPATPPSGSAVAPIDPPSAGPVGEAPAPRTTQIVVNGRAAPDIVIPAPGDPHERFNRRMFRRYQKLDRGLLRPAALGYKHVVPRPLRTGIRHFFSNLTEPVVFLNFLLQGKVGKAIETLGRFVTNSTVGIGGLVDVAKSPGINLPHRPNGFGDTLGFYGVKPGAYLFLPLIGPTTVRDLFGGQVVDGAVNGALFPLVIGKPFDKLYFQIPRAVLTGLDERAQADDDLKALLSDAVDPYATLRSVYLQDRAAEIAALHSRRRAIGHPVPANDNLDDPLVDPAGTASAPANAPEMQDPLADPAAPATAAH